MPNCGFCLQNHAVVSYDEEERKYSIVDLGSQNGSFLDGVRLSEAGVKSEAHEILHGSKLQVIYI